MAFTRKYLAGIGIDADKIEAIMEAHVEVVDGLKAKIAESGDRAEELANVTAELEQAKSDLKAAQDTSKAAEKADYKGKYESEKAAHDQLKADTEAAKTRTAKESVLREALKAEGFADAGIEKILRYSGLVDSAQIDDSGKLTNSGDLVKTASEEWGEYKGKQEPAAASAATPPADVGGKKAVTWEDIDEISNPADRQKAMLENMESLGLK